jgi:hypothetical protein
MFAKNVKEMLELKMVKFLLLSISIISFVFCVLFMLPQVQIFIINMIETTLLHRELKDPNKWKFFLFLSGFFFTINQVVVWYFYIKRNLLKNLPLWDILSLIVIILFLETGLIYVRLEANFPGESDDYVIATISLLQHGSLDIREDDICKLESEGYSDWLSEYVRDNFENNRYINDVYGRQYPFYMGTYSISVLPIRLINEIFNLPQTYTYHISNVLYYALALLVVYLCFKQTRKNVFLAVLLLACSPVFVYISWASAEMFICSLMIVSLVFFVNGNRHLSALFMSIAATLNITICGFGLVIIADYFVYLYNKEKETKEKLNIINLIKDNWKNIFGFAIFFLPALITPLWNLYHYHKITPQIGMAQFDIFWLKRFFAYLFDLNFGFLPYFPILLILFILIVIVEMYKRDRQTILLAFGFFVVVFLYSAMGHINCGMTAMSRYNSWSFPFLVLMVVSQYGKLFQKRKIQQIVLLSMFLSSCTTLILTKSVMDYNGGSYVYFTPISKFFLDKAPFLYNPYPFTFISRNEHYDGGYDYNANTPFVYFTDDGFARKILIPPKCNNPKSYFNFNLSTSEDDMNWLNKQAQKLKKSNASDWKYINITSNRNIIRNNTKLIDYLPKLNNSDYLVIISAKDEASNRIDDSIAYELSSLGLRTDLRGQYRKSYIAIIDSGNVVYEDLQNDKIEYKEMFGAVSVQVTSAGFEVGDSSSIRINGRELSRNMRGLNIVIFDKQEKTVIDRVGFDTYDQLQCFR